MTDEKVMGDVSRGDLDKAAILFERYQQKMFNFFLKMTFERDLSQDMTQNLFLRMIKYRNSFNESLSFKSWIYQIARNVHYDYYRKQKGKFSKYTDLEAISDQMAQQGEDKEQIEREKSLHKALTLLDQEQREILIMSKFQKLKYSEIGKIMNCSEGAVKVKIHRAIKKLKGLYFMVENN
ncbi:MAG: sigma-70 family RNA polymerase sigma factor [Flammeovirgaceae bacterium]|nr:sigma-70 family RNA polymerase sigma factor [Flammeovirgaceae bacterium]